MTTFFVCYAIFIFSHYFRDLRWPTKYDFVTMAIVAAIPFLNLLIAGLFILVDLAILYYAIEGAFRTDDAKDY
jgi:hypothetical protein